MAQFIYKPDGLDEILIGDREAQWKAHLRHEKHVSDVEVATNEAILAFNERADQSDQMFKETQQAQAEQAEVMLGAITQGMGNVQEGMEGLQDQMADVESAVYTAATAQIMDARRNAANIIGAIEEGTERIGSALSDGLGMLIDQQRVGNLLSRNIAELLRVPDFQKERLYFMEQGFKHYKNAAIDPTMMVEALDNLHKAEEREKSDYITLHRLGMIYLYSPAHVDAAKAEDYFLRAGRYAVVESEPEAARLALVLTGHLDESLTEQQVDPAKTKLLASDIYLQAAFACYILDKFADAVTHAKHAAELSPGNMVPILKTAKYLAAENRIDNSVKLLEQAIRTDRKISVLAADDPDLATKSEVTTLLERLRDEAARLLDDEITKLEALDSPLLERGEIFDDDFVKVKQRRQDGRYLELLAGLDTAKKLPDQINEELEARRIAEELRIEGERLETEARQKKEEHKKAEQRRLDEERIKIQKLSKKNYNKMIDNKVKGFPLFVLTIASMSGIMWLLEQIFPAPHSSAGTILALIVGLVGGIVLAAVALTFILRLFHPYHK